MHIFHEAYRRTIIAGIVKRRHFLVSILSSIGHRTETIFTKIKSHNVIQIVSLQNWDISADSKKMKKNC